MDPYRCVRSSKAHVNRLILVESVVRRSEWPSSILVCSPTTQGARREADLLTVELKHRGLTITSVREQSEGMVVVIADQPPTPKVPCHVVEELEDSLFDAEG